jgi:hypothetical protein
VGTAKQALPFYPRRLNPEKFTPHRLCASLLLKNGLNTDC